MDVPSSSVYNINYCKMCDALWRVLSYPPSPPSSRNGDVCSPEEVSSQYTSTPLDLCWPPTAPPWYKSYHPPLLGGVDCSENEIKRCHSCCAFYLIHASLLPFQTKHRYLHIMNGWKYPCLFLQKTWNHIILSRQFLLHTLKLKS